MSREQDSPLKFLLLSPHKLLMPTTAASDDDVLLRIVVPPPRKLPPLLLLQPERRATDAAALEMRGVWGDVSDPSAPVQGRSLGPVR